MQVPESIKKINGKKLLCAARRTINTFVHMWIANKIVCLNRSSSCYNSHAHLTKETASFRILIGNESGRSQSVSLVWALLTCVRLLLEHWWQRRGRLRPQPNQTSCVSFPCGADCARHVFHTAGWQREIPSPMSHPPHMFKPPGWGLMATHEQRHVGILGALAIQTFSETELLRKQK